MAQKSLRKKITVLGEPADPASVKRRFLKLYAQRFRHQEVLTACGIPWSVVSQWLHRDKEFALAYYSIRVANDQLTQIHLLEEADRLAIEGWYEPVFYQGEAIGQVWRFSARLLGFLLRAHDPERYGPHPPKCWGGS